MINEGDVIVDNYQLELLLLKHILDEVPLKVWGELLDIGMPDRVDVDYTESINSKPGLTVYVRRMSRIYIIDGLETLGNSHMELTKLWLPYYCYCKVRLKKWERVFFGERDEVEVPKVPREDGYNKGYKLGFEVGFEEGRIIALIELVRDGILDIPVAASEANMSEAMFQGFLKQSGGDRCVLKKV